jgi:hypothetical protein
LAQQYYLGGYLPLITPNDFSLSEFDTVRRGNLVQMLKQRTAEFFAVIPTDPLNPVVEFYAASDLLEEMVRKVFADCPGDVMNAYLLDLKLARERRIGDWKALGVKAA